MFLSFNGNKRFTLFIEILYTAFFKWWNFLIRPLDLFSFFSQYGISIKIKVLHSSNYIGG